MLEENKDLVRRAFDLLWNEVNLTGVDEIFAADFVWQTPAIQVREDREAIKRTSVNARVAFSDMQLSITDQIAKRDRVVSFYSRTGTHLTSEDVATLLTYLEMDGEPVTARPLLQELPDRFSLPFLEVAAEAGAILITGNIAHYPEAQRCDVQVVGPAEFINIWGK